MIRVNWKAKIIICLIEYAKCLLSFINGTIINYTYMHRFTTSYHISKMQMLWKHFLFWFVTNLVQNMTWIAMKLKFLIDPRQCEQSSISPNVRMCLIPGWCSGPMLGIYGICHYFLNTIGKIMTSNPYMILDKECYLWSFWRPLLSDAINDLRECYPLPYF